MQLVKYWLLITMIFALQACNSVSSKNNVSYLGRYWQEPGVYNITKGEVATKKLVKPFRHKKRQITHLSFKPNSIYKDFKGVSNHTAVGDSPELSIGHLIYKNGDEYKGSFLANKYSGLGQLKTKSGIKKGVFLDGKLVKPLNINLDFDFEKMIQLHEQGLVEYGIEKTYVDKENNLAINMTFPTYGKYKNGEFSGWVTQRKFFGYQYTANMPHWRYAVKKPEDEITKEYDAYFADEYFPDFRGKIGFETVTRKVQLKGVASVTQKPRVIGCSTFRKDGKVFKTEYSDQKYADWKYSENGFYFHKSQWKDGKLSHNVPGYISTKARGIKFGLKEEKDFEHIKKSNYSKIRDYLLQEAIRTKPKCLDPNSERQIANYLKRFKEDNQVTSTIVAGIIKKEKAARERKERLAKARNARIASKYRADHQAHMTEHWNATASCGSPQYSHGSGTIMCGGKRLRPISISLRDVKPSYLTRTRMGLIPVSSKMRRDMNNRGSISVIAAHPNLTNRSVHQCPVCKGKGFNMSQRANTTRYTPTHEYRNGLKITKRTSITTTQNRYGGICGRCLGHGIVPSAWNGYNNR